MTKLIVTFRNFVNAPKKLQYIVYMKYGISHLTMKTVLKLHKKANRLEVQLYCLKPFTSLATVPMLDCSKCPVPVSVGSCRFYRPDCSDNS